MSEKNRIISSNDAVENILSNMNTEMQSNDGQFVSLGFTPPNVSEPINWGTQAAPNNYMNYALNYSDPHLGQPSREQLSSYVHPNNSLFEPVVYQKNVPIPDYNNFNVRSNSAPQNLYHYPDENIMHEPLNHNATQLFENLVGNWAVPNNTRTYTPFGNTDTFKPSIFDFKNQNRENFVELKEDMKFKHSELVNDKFNFNRDIKKSRPLAEVKPMRPSYSDVLTKPVPSTSSIKSTKTEVSKEAKLKKDTRKNGKVDKTQKASSLLNRSNTNNDIKDISAEKSFTNGKNERKPPKSQLNRKWASLDNISEPNTIKHDEPKKIRKPEDNNINNKPVTKTPKNKLKCFNNISDVGSNDEIKAESINFAKNSIKKSKISRQKQNEGHGSGNERPSSKRIQRIRKKETPPVLGIASEKIKVYTKEWWKVFAAFVLWLFHLISDICSLSVHLGRDFALNCWSYLVSCWSSFVNLGEMILKRWRLSAWIWKKFEEKFKGKSKKAKLDDETNSFLQNGLETNISMPTTGEEAMKRLLACKGKDPYSILGVTPKCTDDDIKKYYKRQAFLVHPDKNNQPGAEEAFKILVHAFDMIGTAERRATYDRGVAESAFVVQNFSQMAELLQKLQQKMEMNANTIRCSACNDRHKRIKVDRPSYAARNCNMCKIHHAAREGDIWAEARCFGFLWHYYACMEGSVYDITAWAGCQKETLKHLRPDTHHVQYRIALGKQNTQPRKNSSQTPRMDRPDLENLLSSLYGYNESGASKRKAKNKK